MLYHIDKLDYLANFTYKWEFVVEFVVILNHYNKTIKKSTFCLHNKNQFAIEVFRFLLLKNIADK